MAKLLQSHFILNPAYQYGSLPGDAFSHRCRTLEHVRLRLTRTSTQTGQPCRVLCLELQAQVGLHDGRKLCSGLWL